MAEAKTIPVEVIVKFDTKYPQPPSTMEERIKAAQVSKPLLSAQTLVSSSGVDITSLIRLAEYLATGHDYMDTHPVDLKAGKKERKRLRKEIREMVREEVEEELDARSEGSNMMTGPIPAPPFIDTKAIQDDEEGKGEW